MKNLQTPIPLHQNPKIAQTTTNIKNKSTPPPPPPKHTKNQTKSRTEINTHHF
ncbi:hypothetical protein Hanom_Chr07g00622651 [Helianthus anomalus]